MGLTCWTSTPARRATSVGTRKRRPRRVIRIEADRRSTISPSVDAALASSSSFSSAAPPPPMLHGCLLNVARVSVRHADELALRLAVVELVDDRPPDQPFAGSSGVLGSPRMPSTARTVVADRLAVAAEEDHRRRAVAGDVGARGVDDVRQVHRREELLDQLLAELALHERVGRDHPDVARPVAAPSGGDGQVEEPLGERHAERVLPVAGSRSARGSASFSAASLTVMYGGLPTTAWYCRPRIALQRRRRPRSRRAGRTRLVAGSHSWREPAVGRSASPCSRLSPTATWIVEAGRLGQPRARRTARSAATSRRKRAIATANGLRSTPSTASSARCASTRRLGRRLALGPAAGTAAGTRRAGSGPSRRSGRSAGPPPGRTRRGPASACGRG